MLSCSPFMGKSMTRTDVEFKAYTGHTALDLCMLSVPKYRGQHTLLDSSSHIVLLIADRILFIAPKLRSALADWASLSCCMTSGHSLRETQLLFSPHSKDKPVSRRT